MAPRLLRQYSESPDGTECHRKAYASTSVGGAAGLIWSAYSVTLNPPDSVLEGVARAGRYTFTAAAIGAVFGITSCVSAQVREKPDDPLNYFIGGCAGGLTLGARTHNYGTAAASCVCMGTVAALFKMGQLEGWELFSKPKDPGTSLALRREGPGDETPAGQALRGQSRASHGPSPGQRPAGHGPAFSRTLQSQQRVENTGPHTQLSRSLGVGVESLGQPGPGAWALSGRPPGAPGLHSQGQDPLAWPGEGWVAVTGKHGQLANPFPPAVRLSDLDGPGMLVTPDPGPRLLTQNRVVLLAAGKEAAGSGAQQRHQSGSGPGGGAGQCTLVARDCELAGLPQPCCLLPPLSPRGPLSPQLWLYLASHSKAFLPALPCWPLHCLLPSLDLCPDVWCLRVPVPARVCPGLGAWASLRRMVTPRRSLWEGAGFESQPWLLALAWTTCHQAATGQMRGLQKHPSPCSRRSVPTRPAGGRARLHKAWGSEASC